MKEGTEMDDDWRVRWNIGVLGLLSVVAVSFGFGQHEASTRAEEVQIQNGGVVLSGTITMPTTQGPHPAIMLIHGSIPADRTDPFFQTFVKLFSKRSEEHTSELQSRLHLVCRLLLEKNFY